jgi:hypothetical protein
MADEIGGEPGGTLFTSPRNRRRFPGSPLLGFGLLVVIGVAAGAGWYWLRSRGTAPEPVPSAVGSSVAPATGEEPFVLPALGASDAVVRSLLAGLSSHPQLAAWLVPDELVRRFVQAVVDISRGSSPVPALEVLIPAEPFSVEPSGDRLLMSPQSQRRYDLLSDVFTSVDADAAARVYRQLLPLFREAYQELGYADEEFQEVLARAIRNLLAVEVPEGELEVREAVNRYVYVDSRIEALTPAEKHLIRMGSENARRIQEKLREISEKLELPPVPGGEGESHGPPEPGEGRG